MYTAMRVVRKTSAFAVASLMLTLASCFPLPFVSPRAPRTGRVAAGSNKVSKQTRCLLAAKPASETAENILLIGEGETREFCRSFLVPYGNARSFQLMARNKYAGERLSRTNIQLETNTLSFHTQSSSQQMEDKLIHCIRRAGVLATAEMYRDSNNLPIDADWMACYVSAFPLDVDDACDAFITLYLKRRAEKRRALVKQNDKVVQGALLDPALIKPFSKLESMLQQSVSLQHRLLKFDIDTKDPELIGSLQFAMRDCKCVLAVETRSGFHVIVERGPEMQELWKFARDVNKDVPNDKQWITLEEQRCGALVAVPGTKQGGFQVRLKTDEWREALWDERGYM